MFQQLDAVMTGKGKPIMSNTAKNTEDVKAAGRESNAAVDKLIAESGLLRGADKKTVPAQGEKTETTEEQSTENQNDADQSDETAENEKKSAKDRVTALVQKAKNNKQFFTGVVVGALVGSVTVAKLIKEKVEEVVADDTDQDDASDTAV